MSSLRPLRGGCQCGRNKYIVAMPEDGLNEAQVLFNTERAHQIPLGSPLAAYIRVPLEWYHSTTYSFFPDETHAQIRRVYTHPSHQHAKRHFCGYCGTPLSYWSEKPFSEADYINLTLGSLLREDLAGLEDMGLIRDSEEGERNEDDDNETHTQTQTQTQQQQQRAVAPNRSTALRESYGVPWFDGLVEGTRLGNMRRSQGIQRSADGKVSVEWEVMEYNDDGGSGSSEDVEMGSTTPGGKRKLGDLDNSPEDGQK